MAYAVFCALLLKWLDTSTVTPESVMEMPLWTGLTLTRGIRATSSSTIIIIMWCRQIVLSIVYLFFYNLFIHVASCILAEMYMLYLTASFRRLLYVCDSLRNV